MIFDGYNRCAQIEAGNRPMRFVYRPATKNERSAIQYVWKSIGSTEGTELACKWVSERIVAANFPHASWSLLQFVCAKDNTFPKLLMLMLGLLPDSSGQAWKDVEDDYRQNLYEGIVFERDFPQLAKRSCADCEKYWYSEETGEVLLETDGSKMLRVGPPACRTESGCPKGTPEKQRTLNVANRWAFEHYKQCKATGWFPDDQIVRENAVVIERAIQTPRRVK